MTPPATLVVVRHGQTEWNAGHRWQGWQDSPLTETGIRQAEAARRYLASTTFDAGYSSDSPRALATAAVLLNGRGLTATPAEALRERNYGVYEGLTSLEIEETYPGTRFDRRNDSRELWAPPGGETLVEVRRRVSPFINDVATRHAGQSILVVTHSGVVRIFDSIAQGRSLDDIWVRHPPNACVLVVEAFPGPSLRIVQDMADPSDDDDVAAESPSAAP